MGVLGLIKCSMKEVSLSLRQMNLRDECGKTKLSRGEKGPA